MKSRKFLFPLLIFWLSAMLPEPAFAANDLLDETEILRLESEIVESRRAIQHGKFELRLQWPVASSLETEQTTLRLILSVNGSRGRQDAIRSMPDRDIQTRAIQTPEFFIRELLPPDGIRDIEMFSSSKMGNVMEVCEPRKLGIIVWSFESLDQFGYETDFLCPGRRNVKSQKIEHQGISAWEIEYDTTNLVGATVHHRYIVPRDSRPPTPVFISKQFATDDGQTHMQSLETTWKSWGDQQIKYPSKVILKYETDGAVESEEHVIVEKAEFNELPQEHFDLKGLDIPVGTQVIRDSHVYFWQGERLRGTLGDSPELATKLSSSRRSLLFANGILFIALAVWYFFRARSK